MFGFLRPIIIVISITSAYALMVFWHYLGTFVPAAEGEPENTMTFSSVMLGVFSWPIKFLPDNVREQMGWIDATAYALLIGFMGWIMLECAWAFIKPREEGEQRSFIPSFAFGRLLSFGLFVLLVVSWLSVRLPLFS